MSNRSRIRKLSLAAVVAAFGCLALPALAFGHAVVSPFQPQTNPVAAARTLYVLRLANEKPVQPTYKVVLHVPAAIQEGISVKQAYDWKTRLTRKDTGKKDAEGNSILATTAISWTAKRGAEIDPGFFGEFYLRFVNPAAGTQLCFPVLQYYRAEEAKKSSPRASKKKRKRARKAPPEVVGWTGPPNSEFPASCVTIGA